MAATAVTVPGTKCLAAVNQICPQHYLRRQIHETPRFAMAGGAHEEAAAAIADAKDANLLVLGTRGRSPLAGLLLGSVSQTCAAAAPCPVVLVKKGDFPES